jgi:hypothetical protein
MGASIHDILAGQMDYTYFPVSLDQFFAKVAYANVFTEEHEIACAGPERITLAS